MCHNPHHVVSEVELALSACLKCNQDKCTADFLSLCPPGNPKRGVKEALVLQCHQCHVKVVLKAWPFTILCGCVGELRASQGSPAHAPLFCAFLSFCHIYKPPLLLGCCVSVVEKGTDGALQLICDLWSNMQT